MAKRGAVWTLATLNTDVSTRLDDSAHTRWTSAQKDVAINAAVRRARGRWWEERTDAVNTYDEEAFRYTLPPAVENIEAVYFDALSSDRPRYFTVPTLWHIEENYLVFDDRVPPYDGQTMYIHYTVYPSNLLTVTNTNGVIDATGLTLTSTGSTFVTKGVMPGDEVEITGDTGGPYYVSSITSETVLVLHKAATAGSTKTFYVARYTDLPYEYLIYASMGELYEMASRNRPGVEVEENIRWATYYRQLADMELNQQRRHPRPQRRY